MEYEYTLKCYCCNETIILTKTNVINKRTTVYDGDFYHKACFNYEKYGKPYIKQADKVICDVCSECVSQIHLRRHKKGKKCLKINYCSNNA